MDQFETFASCSLTTLLFLYTFQDHLKNLLVVFSRLADVNLELITKCSLFKKHLHYVGHKISRDGIAADLAKISAIVDWPISRSTKEVKTCLGLTTY